MKGPTASPGLSNLLVLSLSRDSEQAWTRERDAPCLLAPVGFLMIAAKPRGRLWAG